MSVTITLLRHGETEANAADIWQGNSDSPLTDRGNRQSARTAERLRGRHFDLVVSSDLDRATSTATALGVDFETDPALREMNLGRWDGLTRGEVLDRFSDQLAALRSGENTKIGGGESYPEFAARVDAAIERVAARLGDGERAMVVTHGGVLHAVVAGHLDFRGRRRPWPVGRMYNCSLTTLRINREGDNPFAGPRELAIFNDADHLDGDHEGQPMNGSVVRLIRHGESQANRDHRWQGIGDDPLTEEGRRQAGAMAERQSGLVEVYSSSLSRARATAGAIAHRWGIPQREDSNLMEIDYGSWEDLTTDQIRETWLDQWRLIYEDGQDLPRGESGETFAAAGERMQKALNSIANGTGPVAAVSHAGSIRAAVAHILGLGHAGHRLLGYVRNTASSEIVFSKLGPVLADYNMAPHLDER